MTEIVEVIGYCARAGAVNNTGKLMPYIIQNFFILVSPALFAASIYMTLGRIMRCIKGEHHSIVRITWVTKAFVVGDVLSFLVQGGSAGLMFNSSTVKIGEDIVILGLFIQIVSFSLFFLTAVVFQVRMKKSPTPESYHVEAPWKQTLFMLYAVSILILVRSIFRVIEYIQGQSGYSLRHEWTLYVFDSVPMFIVTVIFYLQYPSKIPAPLPGSEESLGIQAVRNAESHEPKSSS